ncbi:biotin--[Clostridium sp. D2Q-14]|uniref:biotin--[acetyl-CoA-carboxylase] ligase n=1 Tax=Anaeromonas gelatinilytica TaxID=2683194 RepID=UPI00193BDF30|nr:biotin--[acetyl-CoA-carboxylase] ligase [Anaeromonas gelatinilytica]
MKDKIIEILRENKGLFISGQDISDKLNVSRTSIWKHISKLKEEGYIIESVSRKGYRLLKSPDLLEPSLIDKLLNTKYMGRKIYHYDSIDSTNNEAKKLAQNVEEGTIVIAEEQLGGKGRLNRKWTSPKRKGIWMSAIFKPNISPSESPKITQIAAAAVSKAIEGIGISNKIKWPNDIVIRGRKVCGILTEMSGEINRVNYIIIGIGVNVNLEEKDFLQDIRNNATSLKIEKRESINRVKLIAKILNEFEYLYEDFINTGSIKNSVDICKKNSALIDKRVRVINGNNIKEAIAMDIDENGRLLVRYDDGSSERIISGEISIRGIKGYV